MNKHQELIKVLAMTDQINQANKDLLRKLRMNYLLLDGAGSILRAAGVRTATVQVIETIESLYQDHHLSHVPGRYTIATLPDRAVIGEHIAITRQTMGLIP